MDKELHIRVTGDAHAKLKQLSKINNVTMSDAVRYVINHHFHKEELPNYDDAWVAIIPYMGALAVAPYLGTAWPQKEIKCN